MQYKLGLIVNPLAGLGGSVALKGSDGVAVQALAKGAKPKAGERCLVALNELKGLNLKILCFAGEMGTRWAQESGLDYQEIGAANQEPSNAADTIAAARQLMNLGVDIIMFAGGDGTARDILDAICDNRNDNRDRHQIPVVGIPSGVKIHSGVYAISPKAAGKVVAGLVGGELVSLRSNEVRDIDEAALRQGRVLSRYYGELLVPEEHQYMQATKSATGKEDESLVLDDIADYVIEQMRDDVFYIMGSGSTVAAVMERLALDNTLLGVDVVRAGKLVASDVTAEQLLSLYQQAHAQGFSCQLYITTIGGQGHIIGRGNQQLSPELLRLIGLENIHVLATKTKLKTLESRPLLIDSGDVELDAQWHGLVPVICGYKDEVLYPLGHNT